MVYHVFKYRRKVVRKNIENSFPEKSPSEIRSIESKFYLHFTDLVIESVKMFSVSESGLKKRMRSMNSEIFDKYYEQKRNLILASGHYGNWEMWATAGAWHMPHSPMGVYKPLKNKFWDTVAKKSRGKFGMNLIPVQEASAKFGLMEEPCALVLLMDQSPARTKKCYWTTFLNQETPVNFGVEALSKKNDAVVFYGDIQKVKRGYYEVTWSLITDNSTKEEHGMITEKVTARLEKKIRSYPHLWLWTHKRWKRERRPDEELLNVLKDK